MQIVLKIDILINVLIFATIELDMKTTSELYIRQRMVNIVDPITYFGRLVLCFNQQQNQFAYMRMRHWSQRLPSGLTRHLSVAPLLSTWPIFYATY